MRADDGSVVISARLMGLICILLGDVLSAPNAKEWHEPCPMIARNKAVGFIIPIRDIYGCTDVNFVDISVFDDVNTYYVRFCAISGKSFGLSPTFSDYQPGVGRS